MAAGELFDLPFAAHGLFFCAEGFVVNQSYRAAGFGVFGTFSGIVGFYALLQVGGPAGVEGIVFTEDDVGISDGLGHKRAPFLWGDLGQGSGRWKGSKI